LSSVPSHSLKRGLGSRFRAICLAAGVSSLGDGAVLVGFPLVAASLTKDPRLVAGVAAAQRLPWLFSLVTGALADRLDRRRLMASVEGGRMLTLLLLGACLGGRFHPLLALYACAFVLGTFETAFQAASNAILPSLVEPEDRAKANGNLYAVQMAAQGVAGPAVGGLLITLAISLPFLFDGVSFWLSAMLLLIALPAAVRKKGPGSGSLSALTRSVLAEVHEGLSWFLGRRAVRLSALYVSALAFCQSGVLAILVLWARQDLHVSAVGYSVLIATGALGLVLAGLLTGRLYHRAGASVLLVVAGAVAAGAYVVLSLTRSPILAAAVMFCEGAAVSTGNVVNGTLRQKLIPQHLLGRVGNAMRTCIFGAMPLGALAGGLLASYMGLRATLMTAGLSQALMVAVLAPRMVGSLSIVGVGRSGGSSPSVGMPPEDDPTVMTTA
jgi:MFS family permease